MTTDFSLGEERDKGAEVGTLSVDGSARRRDARRSRSPPTSSRPTAWWRLTHPLELFGLT